MKWKLLFALLPLALLQITGATVAPNIPISGMPIASTLQTNAWIPIIQPLPGRTTNDNFRVAPSAFAAFLGTNNTSGSNVFNTIIVTNITVVTNITITTNVTIIVQGNTNLAGLWTDTLGDYTPTQADQNTLHATNIYSMQTLHSSGALIFDAAATYNFLAPTNVCINPFNLGYLLIDGATTNASDTQIRLESGNGSGAILLIQNVDEGYGFHMLNGDTLCSDPSLHLYLKGGDWYSTHEGETILLLGTPRGWAEIGRFGGPTNFVTGDLWQVVGGVLQPVDLTLQPMIQNGLSVGTNTLAFWGSNLTNGEALVSTKNPDLGDPDSSLIDLSVLNNDGVGTRFQLQLHTNYTRMQNWNKAVPAGTLNMLEWTVDTNEAYLDLQIGGSIRTALRPNTSTSTVPFQVDSALPRYGSAAPIMTFGNYGTNMLSVNWNGGLIFGPGTTNVLYRSGSDLVYTNNSTDTKFLVANTSGNFLSLEAQSLTGFLSAAGSANAVGLRQGTNQVLLSGGVFSPIPDSSQSLGSQSERWLNYSISGTGYTYGYLTNSTNYSLLAVSHTGTNGAVVFDSQSSGDAGGPRPIALEFNGTNLFQFDSAGNMTWGPGSTNVLYRDGSNLIYANSGSSPSFRVQDSSTNQAWFGLEAPGYAFVRADSGKVVSLGVSGGNDLWYSGAILYAASGAVALGYNSHPFSELSLNGPIYNYGYQSGTNASQFVQRHTGTNGVGAGIVFQSLANGTGGNPRPFVFTNAPVQLPWFTSVQKTNLAEVADGMLIYQTDNTPGIRARVGGAWVLLSTSADP